ncbi:hypothetical protein NXX09_22330 [Bacteroides uniformis]|nr:hypothetical protein [Bacteroides uniformis]
MRLLRVSRDSAEWTDYKPDGDFSEAILNTSFDWNGVKHLLSLRKMIR